MANGNANVCGNVCGMQVGFFKKKKPGEVSINIFK